MHPLFLRHGPLVDIFSPPAYIARHPRGTACPGWRQDSAQCTSQLGKSHTTIAGWPRVHAYQSELPHRVSFRLFLVILPFYRPF